MGKLTLWICVGLMCGWRIIGVLAHHTPEATVPINDVDVVAQVVEEADLRDGWAQVVVDSKEYGHILARLPRDGEYALGDVVRLKGRLNLPRNFSSESGREFDYINYLAKDGIQYQMNAPHIISHIQYDAAGTSEQVPLSLKVRRRLVDFKKEFIVSVQQSLHEPYASLAIGLVVGGKSSLGKEWNEDFRKAGLIHAVVLSGYNVSIVVAILLGCLTFLPKHIRFAVGVIGIVAFALMTGASTTIIRASIMAVIALYAEVTLHTYSVIRALFVAALIMVLWNPLTLLYDPSFHLSFLATLGLILFSKIFLQIITWLPGEGLRDILSTTLATQVLVAPYILYFMGQLSVLGIIANVLVSPMIPLTMLFVVLMAISNVFQFISFILLKYIFLVVEIIASSKYAALEVPRFSFTFVIVAYIVIFGIYFVASRKFASTNSQLTLAK